MTRIQALRATVRPLAMTAAMGRVLPLLFAGRRRALEYQAYNTKFFGALVMLITLVLVTVRMKRLDATVGD